MFTQFFLPCHETFFYLGAIRVMSTLSWSSFSNSFSKSRLAIFHAERLTFLKFGAWRSRFSKDLKPNWAFDWNDLLEYKIRCNLAMRLTSSLTWMFSTLTRHWEARRWQKKWSLKRGDTPERWTVLNNTHPERSLRVRLLWTRSRLQLLLTPKYNPQRNKKINLRKKN